MAELQDRLEQSRSETEEAQNAEQRAMEEKAQAEEDLRELQDEMANKSFTTKGLSRQLEEKGSRLEEELQEARKQNDTLKDELESKARHEARLEEQFQKVRREMNEERQRLLDEADISRDELNTLQQEHEKLAAQLQDALDDLKRKEDEKDLLHTRHHALTDESGSLQRELARAQSTIRELQQAVDDEKRNSLESNQGLRTQNKEEIEHLQEEIESLHHEIEDKEGRFALDEDRWESTKRTLQLQKERAEEQAAGFKRTIEKLQQVEHSLSGKEIKLQEVIDSEKTRHHHEEAVLSRQVQELNDDLASKRQVIEELRTDFLSTKEELRISKREEQALKEKVQALEDEVVILQASLEDEREYAKGKVKKGPSDIETQLQKATTDKQSLRDQLANANVELHRLKTSLAEFEVERDELQAQLDQAQNQAGNTHQFDKEKVDLRKSKLRLESEVTRLKEERSSLVKAKESIETQLNAEIERATTDENRLSAEIDQLQDRLATASGDKDRELVLSKSRTQRLERRIHELEALVEQQVHVEPEVSIGNADVSLLRHNLDEARKRERALLQREADQKALVRSFKTRIADLEKELHDALMKKYDTNSPVSSPSDKLHSELRSLRKQLSEAHKSLRDLRAKNRDLERNAMREEDQRDLHELLKSSTLEAESLALKVSERDARLNELKTQVRKVREERAFCVKKAETASKELATLQDRYDQAIEKIGVKSENKGRHEKEIRGLSREIIWLRARLKREERFRRDLAWSKGLMELGERVRTACNEADLRMIAEMGVKARSPDHSRTPRHKFKTAISMVVATVRMQKMGREWKKTKKLSEGLKRAKNEVLKRRDG
ncbi:hypothetical protein ASPZODRAFT_379486 [Penicilliopsis zonata CBS 506.65]|uniref:Pericentrin/AKAP-450 centrosomal targeting domain-containing protein n=1 Tax=Penicilliopsis zonata CBS 506.65 TaxID=1073090 RepID=A0A1L9SWH9_9EURO|nr:hypothetical protein ASPZODRAFT_379486 [Penicilliopsis zonata CBS 506.65]OJJ51403.1 hypothetical protein ASPZODRAFT_379486 [Penicilliopsis zonata CBS 506.65]